ncbi:metallophosphoesterase [Aquibacillus albus]|uniref:MPP superfamily phosphohydrolase n=1 Tax=Aquibacillus albus TaxID=1168171 RepID=A0ABS2MV80_9BACI|nr:metallophosphoesterase [Aquibacillus albus]MBM7569801.1 putative MPP superfamily phosphohydrolase [Aquibacillus albus]
MIVTITSILVIFISSLIGFMVYKAHRDLIDVRDIELGLTSKPFKIFFISDIHTRKIKTSTILKIKEEIDIVIIGGDLVEKGVPLDRVEKNIKLLQTFEARIYFIWGNNDYEVDILRLTRMLKDNNVYILKNQGVSIQHDMNTFTLVGLDYMKTGKPKIMDDFGLDKDGLHLLITHDPNVLPRLEKSFLSTFDLVLSGHTHGGQIRFLGIGPYTRGGLKKVCNKLVFTSEGYGYTKFPFRLGTNAECHVLILK